MWGKKTLLKRQSPPQELEVGQCSGHYLLVVYKTSLLRRLQEQTLPDATPTIGPIHPFSKMTVTSEPLMGF